MAAHDKRDRPRQTHRVARLLQEEWIDGHSNFRHQRTPGQSTARRHRADGECLRYRLDVVAASAVDVVQSAGGWLYDRVMAGWEVTVLLPHGCDTRPLRILGVRALDLEWSWHRDSP